MPIPEKKENKKRVSAAELIYETVKEWIIEGTLLPGETINESELSKYFSVSRTPVHEAVHLLARYDLVDVTPSKGTHVASLDEDSAADIYEALAAVTAEIGRLACRRATEADIHELEVIDDRFKRTAASDPAKLPEVDSEFHGRIADIAGNSILKRIFNDLVIHSKRCEYFYFSNADAESDISWSEHQKIIEALKNRDEDAAARYSWDNWEGFFRNRLQKVMKKGPQPQND